MADLDARGVGNMRQNAQNAEQTKVIRNSNNFPLDYSHPTSHRYGDVDIFYHYFGERGDTVPLRTAHSIFTPMMASPNEIDIYMRKHFVHVPLKAIYPYTWDEVLYPLPVDGDIAPDDARANFDVVSYVQHLVSSINFLTDWDEFTLPHFIRCLDALSNVLSNGSLLAKCNIHLSSMVEVTYVGMSVSLDRFVSLYYAELFEALQGNKLGLVRTTDSGTSTTYIQVNSDPLPELGSPETLIPVVKTWHQLHDYLVAYDYNFTLENPLSSIDVENSWDLSFSSVGVNENYPKEQRLINIEPIIAYQLSCAQFYTNDRVDNIYSANTFRNYFKYLLSEASIFTASFLFNDVEYLYDVFSQHYFDIMLDRIDFGDDADYSIKIIRCLDQLFSYRKSLRFGDYFTGARVSPLAVGESSVPVTGDGVQVEDITRSAALQRLRYNINVLGRKINNQLMGLIPGLAPDTPDDIPTSIASQDFNIGKHANTVNNTGEAQVSTDSKDAFPITSYLNGGSSDFVFKINITEPCILLGLVSFSVPRVYSKTVDRFAFHHDRYDMFIPQMQFIGDQEIYQKELFGLNGTFSPDAAFAYNQRYSEYKQRYSYASGAFVEFLPSWEMITDNSDGTLSFLDRYISSYIAHSINSEFDRFFKSITGNSLADYFHFVVKHYNISTPNRAFAWNPEPLL